MQKQVKHLNSISEDTARLLETIEKSNYIFTTIEQIQERHEESGKNRYFFSPETMRAFSSKISSTVKAGCAFITSERDKSGHGWNGKRRYTIRAIAEDGQIISGEHGEFKTLAQAKAALNKLTEETHPAFFARLEQQTEEDRAKQAERDKRWKARWENHKERQES